MRYAHLDRLSNWSRFRPSLCKGCWAGCCRLPVEAGAADLVRLGLLEEDEATGSLKKAARRLLAAGKIKQFRASTGIFTLSQTPDGDCIFLGAKDRMCTVYDKRPSVCRRFPEEIGPRPGFCPAATQLTSPAAR
jgi:Fe-S-cluster containining protein